MKIAKGYIAPAIVSIIGLSYAVLHYNINYAREQVEHKDEKVQNNKGRTAENNRENEANLVVNANTPEQREKIHLDTLYDKLCNSETRRLDESLFEELLAASEYRDPELIPDKLKQEYAKLYEKLAFQADLVAKECGVKKYDFAMACKLDDRISLASRFGCLAGVPQPEIRARHLEISSQPYELGIIKNIELAKKLALSGSLEDNIRATTFYTDEALRLAVELDRIKQGSYNKVKKEVQDLEKGLTEQK